MDQKIHVQLRSTIPPPQLFFIAIGNMCCWVSFNMFSCMHNLIFMYIRAYFEAESEK